MIISHFAAQHDGMTRDWLSVPVRRAHRAQKRYEAEARAQDFAADVARLRRDLKRIGARVDILQVDKIAADMRRAGRELAASTSGGRA